MPITSLDLRQFTSFEKAYFEFVPGLNVLIGENSTGKSHVLKALYSVFSAALAIVEERRWDVADEIMQRRLMRVFRPDEIDRLIRRPNDFDVGAEIGVRYDLSEGRTPELGTEMVVTIKGGHVGCQFVEKVAFPGSIVFIPSRDVLAIQEQFVPTYEKYKLSFDETYRDICFSLSLPRAERLDEAADRLLHAMEGLLEGRVEYREGRFYVELGEEFEAHLVGEGLRKLAMIVQLVANEQLRPGSVLLWDEPEAGLNPKRIEKAAEFIRALGAWGVQVFIATHDYLLSSRLSLMAANAVDPKVPTRFFSLHRIARDEPVEVETGDTLDEIENNPILEAHADYYDFQKRMFDRVPGDGSGAQ